MGTGVRYKIWGVVGAVALHQRANDMLASFDAMSLPDGELEAAIVDLHREVERCVAAEARWAALYEARRVYRSDGSRSAAARLGRKTGGSRGELRGRVLLGRRLRLMRKVDAALAAGEITVEHARILGKLAASERKPVADAFVGAEEQLVGFARDLSFEDFVRAVRYWEQRMDGEGAEGEADHARPDLATVEQGRGRAGRVRGAEPDHRAWPTHSVLHRWPPSLRRDRAPHLLRPRL